MNVLVFCSSSAAASPLLLAEAEAVGHSLAQAKHVVIYGGASVGMMGRLADGALKAGGAVVGIVPQMDFALDLVHPGLTEQITVGSLSERKLLMLSRADAVVALPGGLGTLDEIFEALVLKSTGALKLPIYFFNLFDFWQPLLEALTLLWESQMISTDLEDLYQVVAERQDLLRELNEV